MIIYDLDTFLNLSKEELPNVTTIYLPNSQLQEVFDNKLEFTKFLDQLKATLNLKSINLRNNALRTTTILEIATMVNSDLEIFNIYSNPKSDESTNSEIYGQAITRLINNGTKIIFESSCDHIPCKLPEPWELNDKYSEQEILEMLAVAKQMQQEHPKITKFHGRAKPISSKKNAKLAIETNKETNLPFSAIILDGIPVLIPKYKLIPDKVLNKIGAYPILNYSSEGKSKGKNWRIVFLNNNNKLQLGWGQTVLSAEQDFFATQNAALLRLNEPILFGSRDASYTGYVRSTRKNQITCQYEYESLTKIHKLYSITVFRGEKDVLEFMNDDFNYDERQKKLMLAFVLEGSCWHNLGVLNLDIKLENAIVKDNNPTKITLVDFHGIRPLREHDRIKSRTFGTNSHRAPEANEATFYSPALDHFACGVTLYTLFNLTDYNSNLPLSLVPAYDQVDRILQNDPNKYAILTILQGLTENNPQYRWTMQQALVELYNIFPEIGKAAIAAKHSQLVSDLHNEYTQYPKAQPCTTAAIKKLKITNDLTTDMNSIFKLQLISYYMNLFRLAGDEKANKELFQRTVQELLSQRNKPVTECLGQYYSCKEVEDEIAKLHNATTEPNVKRNRLCISS